jgi:hypothetical protein
MTTATIPNAPTALAPVRKPLAATRVAFRALILRDLSIAEPTLETVFIDLTGKDLRD